MNLIWTTVLSDTEGKLYAEVRPVAAIRPGTWSFTVRNPDGTVTQGHTRTKARAMARCIDEFKKHHPDWKDDTACSQFSGTLPD